ncbi:hypothetical protein HCB17_19470 [Salinispora arenicola]|uniref:hypothetical protein n=1 Tax=Salinispora arenicola TaxID=168697 RepID=UPI00036DD610|nr:hypothetical protein [Salinispora arenicola]NIL43078.1 hypothetical protein [Salinispora arenicola]
MPVAFPDIGDIIADLTSYLLAVVRLIRDTPARTLVDNLVRGPRHLGGPPAAEVGDAIVNGYVGR